MRAGRESARVLKAWCCVCAACGVWGVSAVAVAQEAEPPPALEDARLTRARAVRLAVSVNVGLMVSRVVRAQASRSARRARRPYVPVVSATLGYRDSASLFEPGVTIRPVSYTHLTLPTIYSV